jgi:hypothetical protein
VVNTALDVLGTLQYIGLLNTSHILDLIGNRPGADPNISILTRDIDEVWARFFLFILLKRKKYFPCIYFLLGIPYG